MSQQAALSLVDGPPTLQANDDWRTRAGLILLRLQKQANFQGFSGTIATAKLTGGGANGSMTFVNGVLTASTAAT
jgi:hypothetical protein